MPGNGAGEAMAGLSSNSTAFSGPISQESCELAGKAVFSGWIFNTVTRSGEIG